MVLGLAVVLSLDVLRSSVDFWAPEVEASGADVVVLKVTGASVVVNNVRLVSNTMV